MKVLKLSKSKSNKKGLMALEALIGIILSVIGLFFVIQLLASIFFFDSSNLLIAKDNAKSVIDFINYFQKDENIYSNIDNCYNYISLFHLENFQKTTVDFKDNYILVINQKGVYILPYNKFTNLISSPSNLENYALEKYYFSIPINLYEDKTSQGWLFSFDFDVTGGLTFGLLSMSVGNFGPSLDLNKNENSLIILKPDLKKYNNLLSNQNKFDIYFYNLNQNSFSSVDWTYEGSIPTEYENNMNQPGVLSSNLLAFSKDIDGQKNVLFAIAGGASELLVKNNLCSYQYLTRNDLLNLYNKDPSQLDYVNNNAIFSCKDDKKDKIEDFNFEWLNGPVCYKNGLNDCSQFNIANNINYKDFLEGIKNICYEQNGESLSLEVKALKLREINVNFLNFEDGFEPLNVDYKLIDLDENKKKNLGVFSMDSIFRSDLNDCDILNLGERHLCNNLIIDDINVYYYVKRDLKSNQDLVFYKFKENFLRKKIVDDKLKFYFLGKEILEENIQEIEADAFGNAKERCGEGGFWSASGFCRLTQGAFGTIDNQNFYKIKLDNIKVGENLNSYEIVLTSIQILKIPFLDNDYIDIKEIGKYISFNEIKSQTSFESKINNCNSAYCSNFYLNKNKAAFYVSGEESNQKYFILDETKFLNPSRKITNDVSLRVGYPNKILFNGNEYGLESVSDRQFYKIKFKDYFTDRKEFEGILSKEQLITAFGFGFSTTQIKDIYSEISCPKITDSNARIIFDPQSQFLTFLRKGDNLKCLEIKDFSKFRREDFEKNELGFKSNIFYDSNLIYPYDNFVWYKDSTNEVKKIKRSFFEILDKETNQLYYVGISEEDLKKIEER